MCVCTCVCVGACNELLSPAPPPPPSLATALAAGRILWHGKYFCFYTFLFSASSCKAFSAPPFLSASRSATLFPSVSCYLFLAVFARLEIIIIIIKRQNQRTAEPTTFAFFSLHSFCTHKLTHTHTHLYTRVFNFETNTFFFVSHSR